MYVDHNTVITVASVLTAIGVIFGAILWCYRWYLKIERKAAQQDSLREQHDADMQCLKKEIYVICVALSACLDGLIQQGCNHSVPEAKEMLDDYLMKQAHE